MDKHKLLQVLKNLRESGLSRKTYGICTLTLRSMHDDITETTDLLEIMFKAWEKYSGDESYPIPSATTGVSPRDKFEMSKFKWQGEYGKLRYELLDHCINWLTEDIKDDPADHP